MTERPTALKKSRALSRRGGQSLRLLSFRRPKVLGGIGEIKEGAPSTGKDLRAFADDAEERYKAINKSRQCLNDDEQDEAPTCKPVRKSAFRQPSLKMFLSQKSSSKRSKKQGSVCSAPAERKNPASGCRSLRTMVNEYEDIVGDF